MWRSVFSVVVETTGLMFWNFCLFLSVVTGYWLCRIDSLLWLKFVLMPLSGRNAAKSLRWCFVIFCSAWPDCGLQLSVTSSVVSGRQQKLQMSLCLRRGTFFNPVRQWLVEMLFVRTGCSLRPDVVVSVWFQPRRAVVVLCKVGISKEKNQETKPLCLMLEKKQLKPKSISEITELERWHLSFKAVVPFPPQRWLK